MINAFLVSFSDGVEMEVRLLDELSVVLMVACGSIVETVVG